MGKVRFSHFYFLALINTCLVSDRPSPFRLLVLTQTENQNIPNQKVSPNDVLDGRN